MTADRAIVVHSLAEARVAAGEAAALNVPVTLISATAAAGYLGPGWFEQMIAAVADEFPGVALTAILDCGETAGPAMAALRWIARPGRRKVTLLFGGDAETARKLADMAEVADIVLLQEFTGKRLELRAAADPAAACRDFLRAP